MPLAAWSSLWGAVRCRTALLGMRRRELFDGDDQCRGINPADREHSRGNAIPRSISFSPPVRIRDVLAAASLPEAATSTLEPRRKNDY